MADVLIVASAADQNRNRHKGLWAAASAATFKHPCILGTILHNYKFSERNCRPQKPIAVAIWPINALQKSYDDSAYQQSFDGAEEHGLNGYWPGSSIRSASAMVIMSVMRSTGDGLKPCFS